MTDSLEGEDLYELLEISPRASPIVIKAAYRALARHYHPDLSTTVEAELRIRRINAAYQVLGDPETRARYDLEVIRAIRSERSVHSNPGFTAPSLRRPVATSRGLDRGTTRQLNRLDTPSIRMTQLALAVFLVVAAGALLFLVLWATLDLGSDASQTYPTAPEFSQR